MNKNRMSLTTTAPFEAGRLMVEEQAKRPLVRFTFRTPMDNMFRRWFRRRISTLAARSGRAVRAWSCLPGEVRVGQPESRPAGLGLRLRTGLKPKASSTQFAMPPPRQASATGLPTAAIGILEGFRECRGRNFSANCPGTSGQVLHVLVSVPTCPQT